MNKEAEGAYFDEDYFHVSENCIYHTFSPSLLKIGYPELSHTVLTMAWLTFKRTAGEPFLPEYRSGLRSHQPTSQLL